MDGKLHGYDNAQRTTEEVQKANESTQQSSENTLNDYIFEPEYERPDSSKAEGKAGIGKTNGESRAPTKFQQYMQRAKDSLAQVKAIGERKGKEFIRSEARENVMSVKEFQELAVKFARDEGVERVAKAGGRQIAGSSVPAWGNIAMGAYDAWDTYKDFRTFVQYARQHKELKPGNFTSAKPYHEVVSAKNARLDRIASRFDSADRSLFPSKFEYNELAAELKTEPHILQGAISHFGGKFSNAKESVNSLEMIISKGVSRNSDSVSNFSKYSQLRASEHGKMVLMGSASDRYHWLLQQAEKELGSGYFNPSSNPKGVIAFERFAYEHLSVSGFSRQEVKKACSQGLGCHILAESKKLPDLVEKYGKSYEDMLRNDALEVFEQRFSQHRSKDLDFQRTRVERIHNESRIANDLKLSSEEIEIHKELQRQMNEYRTFRFQQNREEASRLLGEFHSGRAQNPDPSTSYQFILQYGQDLRGANKDPHIGDIAYKLHAAGHKDADIINTLQQYHPDVNSSRELAKGKFQEVLVETARNPGRQDETKYIQEFKEVYHLEEEKRLHRLDFLEDRAFSQRPPERGMERQPTRSVDPSRSWKEVREQEVER